jgi:arsenate reductase
MITIYHNPRCRKSRETLEILSQSQTNIDVVEYLKNPLNETELKNLISLLNIDAEDLLRKNEAEWKSNFKGKSMSQSEIILAMVEYPKLMERPVVVNKDKAVIARPPQRVLEVI